jgi:hypothetical protein
MEENTVIRRYGETLPKLVGKPPRKCLCSRRQEEK